MLVALVDVAAAGVGLPDLDELVADRSAVAVERRGRCTTIRSPIGSPPRLDGQVGLERVDVGVAEDRRDQLDALGVGVAQVLGGVAQQRAAVRREVQPRLGLAGLGSCVDAARSPR